MLCQALCIISKLSVNSNLSYSPEILNSGQRRPLFCPLVPWNSLNDPEKQKGTSCMLRQALYIISKPFVNSNWSCRPQTLNSGQNGQFIVPLWPWNLRMTQKNNRAPLLCYFKLCLLFCNCWWIQTGVTVRKLPICVKIGISFSRMTLKFDGWPWNTTGHLFYATSSFVLHFVAIDEFKLELWSGNG